MNEFIITFLFLYFIQKSLNYIVYPIKSDLPLDKIENFLSFNSSYTTLEMGRPLQKVDFYFSTNHSKMYITNIDCKKTNLFNSELSSSLLIIGEPNLEDPFNSAIIASDAISFFNNINLTEKIEFEEYYLFYEVDIYKDQTYLCGNIGLSIMKYESIIDLADELDYYLKFIRSQNNYFSFFNYKGEDFFVNDIFLHQEFKDEFKDVESILWINPLKKDNDYLNWDISMQDIYYNSLHFKDNIIFELNPLFELIIGNYEYLNNIQKDFFEFYIDKNICLIKTIKEYKIFECDIYNFKTKDIQKFPNLYMFNSDINHVFEMKGEELFIELNNKIYFKIIFRINNQDNKWIVGKTFFRKYPTIFSPVNRYLGFYVHPNEGIIPGISDKGDSKMKNNVANNTNKTLFNILIIITALIFTFFVLCIGRKLVMLRRKRVNELIDDYYQYDSNEKKSDKAQKEEESKDSIKFSPKEMEIKT